MKQYRKIPVVISAVRWPGYATKEIKEFAGDALIVDGTGKYVLNTPEGHSYALTVQDYIVRGVKGEFYPCKADIFDLTYEAV